MKDFNEKLVYLSSYINVLFLNRWSSSFFNKVENEDDVIICANYLGGYAVKYPKLYFLISYVLYALTPFIAILYYTYLFIDTSIKYLLHRKRNTSYNRLFLYTSRSITKTSKRINLFNANDYILLFPYEKCVDIHPKQHLKIYDLITFDSIVKSFCLSIEIFFIVSKRFGYKRSIYSLNAFKWFLLCQGLKNIDKDIELFMSNQKDRWAMLIDKLPNKTNIIQHGTNIIRDLPNPNCKNLITFCKEDNLYTLIMPIRLSNINKLFAFTELEAKYILKGEEKCKPLVEIIGYNLQLSETKTNNPTILIIGNYIENARIEENIIKHLQKYDLTIFLKSHPLIDKSKYQDIQSKYHFNLVDNNFFPCVDLVFSYPSTLALEYESYNINVVYYNEISENNADIIEDRIENKLNKFITRRIDTK